MPCHHFGVSAIEDLDDVNILTISLNPKISKSENQVSGLLVAYGALKSHC
jgi:hypothetical protein